MGKKKRGHPDVEEILARKWCYYCERDFDDLKILINHQRAKHFKCERCGRRLNTAGGLNVHMTQVHKETLTTIENALPNRSNLDVEIFGMEGIPDDVVASHNQRVLSQFAQAEAERRAATGNQATGASGPGGVKKPKFESPSDLKKRLAEYKAKKAAEQAAGISSGDVTPIGAEHGNLSPALGQSFPAGSPHFSQQQVPFGGPANPAFSPYPSSYSQQAASYQQQPPSFTQQTPGLGFGSPNNPQFPGNQAFVPPQQYPPPGSQNFAPQYQNGPSRPYGAVSPPIPYHPQQGQYQPPRMHTPPQNAPPAQRTGSLPPAPGLPQRPSFGAPPVNAFQMQQMHQGQIPGPPNSGATSYSNHQGSTQQHGGGFDVVQNGQGPQSVQSSNGINNLPVTSQPPQQETATTSFANLTDNAISGISNANDKVVRSAEAQGGVETKQVEGEKKGKKDKDKNTRMIYSDNETSPEEKMATLPRYAFIPDGKEEVVLGDATTAAVAGVVTGPDDVLDQQG